MHGSRAILRALEHRAPDPPLLPADGRARRIVEEAERWGDEVLQPLARRLAWAALKRRPGAMMSYSEGADLPLPDAVARLSAPLVAFAAAQAQRRERPATCAPTSSTWTSTSTAPTTGSTTGAMGGEQPTAADLQVGSGLALLLTSATSRERVEAHECARVAKRWFPDYPGALPAGVLPREWLDARPPSPSALNAEPRTSFTGEVALRVTPWPSRTAV